MILSTNEFLLRILSTIYGPLLVGPFGGILHSDAGSPVMRRRAQMTSMLNWHLIGQLLVPRLWGEDLRYYASILGYPILST